MQNIEEIYKQYCNTVYKYLFCLTGKEDVSEELTQETFAIAVKEINKFKGSCKVSVWLCQIAKNLWYDELRKTYWSVDYLCDLLDNYEINIFDSGAYIRDKNRWPDGSYVDDNSVKLSNFKLYVKERLKHMDLYIDKMTK